MVWLKHAKAALRKPSALETSAALGHIPPRFLVLVSFTCSVSLFPSVSQSISGLDPWQLPRRSVAPLAQDRDLTIGSTQQVAKYHNSNLQRSKGIRKSLNRAGKIPPTAPAYGRLRQKAENKAQRHEIITCLHLPQSVARNSTEIQCWNEIWLATELRR